MKSSYLSADFSEEHIWSNKLRLPNVELKIITF